MRSKMKVRLKVVSLCLIALFVLLPLLSSPVAATINFPTIGAESDNTPFGPIVAVKGAPFYLSPRSYPAYDDSSGVITFNCDCYQKDSNPGGSGSVHYMELNVQKIAPNPVGSLMTTSMYRALNPGQTASPYPTLLSISTNYTTGQSNWEVFSVYVYVEVTDNTTQNSAWNTYYWTVTIM
jgi:hypothetical protein